jgi:hypothetical protein
MQRKDCLGLLGVLIRLGLLACLLSSGRTTASQTPAEVAITAGPDLRELAERADAAIISAGDGIGREYANRLRSEHRPAWLNYFRGQGGKPTVQNQQQVVADIDGLIKLIEAAKTWPQPGVYKVAKTTKPPVIDGKLDDLAWTQSTVWTTVYPFNKTEEGGPKTTWYVTWDDQCLYFAFDCTDTDVVAAEHRRDGPVYSDDCVEMFILPDFMTRTYWEIVVSPNGSVFDSMECKKINQWGADLDVAQNIKGLKHAQTVRGTINKSDDRDEGYVVELAVPFQSLPGYSQAVPAPGQKIHFLLARLDRTDGTFGAYAFRPIQGWGHNIWNHAVMELSK